MRPSRLFQFPNGPALPLMLACAVLVGTAAACSQAAGSDDLSLIIEVSQNVITVENQTGTTLSRGEVSIVPSGKDPLQYTMVLWQMSNGDKRAFYLTSFKNRQGARFIRNQVAGHLVRVTATDSAGKVHEREVPFE